MNIRTTLILFGVLAVGLGVFGLLQLWGVKTAKERTEGGRYVFASLNDDRQPIKAGDFESLVIERENPDTKQPEKLAFRRENAQWKMIEPKTVRTDDAAVASLVNQVMSLQKEKAKLKEAPASYGLDKPKIVVTLGKGKETWKLNVGKAGPDAADPLWYVASSDGPETPLAVRKSRLDKLTQPLGDFRDKRLFTSSFGVTELTLAGKERQKLTFAKKGETQWTLKEPALGDADTTSVNGANLDITSLRVEKNGDYLSDDKPSADLLKQRGLTPEDAAYIVTVSQSAVGAPDKTVTETLLVGKPDPSAQAADAAQRLAGLVAAPLTASGAGLTVLEPLGVEVEAKAKPEAGAGARFAMKVGEDAIFRLSDKALAPLMKGANEFRAKNLLALDATKVDAVNVASGGETLRLRRGALKADASVPADWQLYTDSRAKVAAQNSQVQKLVDALNRVAVRDASAFLDDDAAQRKWFGAEPVDLGLDKPHAEIQLWLEGLERGADGKLPADKEPAFKDAAKGKPAAKVFIGRRDAKRGVVYVRRELPDQKPIIVAVLDPWTAQTPVAMQPGEAQQSYSLSDLAEAGYLAYRDRSLPSLRGADVAKLEAVRPSGAMELTKTEEKDDRGAMVPHWKIVKPIEARSPLAEMLIGGLVGLGAEKLVTDRPTDRDLEEKFGLGQKPFMKFTLRGKPNADGKAEEHVYLIGKKTEADSKHPHHRYARLLVTPAAAGAAAPESNQFVFLVPLQQVQSFDQELRDGVVLPFEGGVKPLSLSLVWRSVDAATKKPSESKLELGLAEDKKTWFVKSLTIDGKDEKDKLPQLDQAKIEYLVGTANLRAVTAGGPRLNPLTTERFIVQSGGPTPAMRLDLASKDAPPRLEATLKFEGGSERTLTVGAEFEPKEAEFPSLAGRNFYYAAASGAPGAVFVVGLPEFRDLCTGPQFFRPQGPVSSAAP